MIANLGTQLAKMFKQKVVETGKENIDTLKKVKKYVENPSSAVDDYAIEPLLNIFTKSFINFSIFLLILFSIYQVFKSSPAPLSDITRIAKGVKKIGNKSK